ncbi:hypothetical protein [Brevundimonas sp.]|uniref:hypothetical protein n=1 Tax=Brevundimonas sp. TaxID=1871086 RepID=UPI00289CA331|nr:hypothetical protein [Brevundimonas sp.]
MNADILFAEARIIVSELPKIQGPSLYQAADLRTSIGRALWSAAYEKMIGLGDAAEEPKSRYFYSWAADILTALGEIDGALEVKPRPEIGTRGSAQTDRILSLKVEAGLDVTGRDISTLFGPKVTKFGRENIDNVITFLDVQVEALHRVEKRKLLNEWIGDSHVIEHGLPLFAGLPGAIIAPAVRGISFSLSSLAETMCAGLLREAENTLREERELPRVGEGWVAETALYYQIKSALNEEIVVQHARPSWLGRQHLDIYLPSRKIAIEYQGAQHDRPIQFFGGEEAFKRTVQRDRRKQMLCRRNAVALIYVRPGYSIEKLLLEIHEACPAKTEHA